MITANELRTMTQQVLAEAAAENKAKEAKRLQRIADAESEGLERAEKILADVPKVAKNAALNGQYYADIFEFQSSIWREIIRQDEKVSFDDLKVKIAKKINDLKSASRVDFDVLKEAVIVQKLMDTLQEAGLNPYANYWWDGDGRDDGYRVGIKW